MIVSGFCKEVFRELPMEFAVEAQKLLSVSLEGVGGLEIRQGYAWCPTRIDEGKRNMLDIKNLQVKADDKEILKGIDLT